MRKNRKKYMRHPDNLHRLNKIGARLQGDSAASAPRSEIYT